MIWWSLQAEKEHTVHDCSTTLNNKLMNVEWALTHQVVFDLLNKLSDFVFLSLTRVCIVVDLVLQISGPVFGIPSHLIGIIDLTKEITF